MSDTSWINKELRPYMEKDAEKLKERMNKNKYLRSKKKPIKKR